MFGQHSHQRCMRGGSGGPRWSPFGGMDGEGAWRGGRRRGGGLGRVLEQGDLRTLVLALIAEQPRHGYDLIKEIEARAGGAYAPSPGVIYPLLTLLEEMGHAEAAPAEGGKKLFAATEAGAAFLEERKDAVAAIFARLAVIRERFADGRAPQIVRAMENLKMALRLRLERGAISDDDAQKIAAAIDAAALAVERT